MSPPDQASAAFRQFEFQRQGRPTLDGTAVDDSRLELPPNDGAQRIPVEKSRRVRRNDLRVLHGAVLEDRELHGHHAGLAAKQSLTRILRFDLYDRNDVAIAHVRRSAIGTNERSATRK